MFFSAMKKFFKKRADRMSKMKKRILSALSSILFLVFCLTAQPASAQYADEYKPKLTRILFLLDGSGSMKDKMDESTRFELSKKIIADYLDSLSNLKMQVESAVRVFGHQYPPADKNCTDTKLMIPFGKHVASNVLAQLNTINPQGWTLISYSLEQAASDFPYEEGVKIVIILITDGLETCGGDPCAVAEMFQRRRISLKPFIIGLGLPEENQRYFDCVGKYFDAPSSSSFNKAMNTVITQALNPTTAQINLLNQFGKPTETNMEVSLFDSHNGELIYNFIHALNEKELPDTLKLDPSGKYDIKVHSFPSVTKKGIELVAGTHNIIAVDVPQGTLKLSETGLYKRDTPLQCLIRKKNDGRILVIQDFNTSRKYLTGEYDLEILTLPVIKNKAEILQGVTKEINIESPGILSLTSFSDGIASVYVMHDDELERIYEFKKVLSKESLLLQPGKYLLMYRLNDKKKSAFTRTQAFEIRSGAMTTLRL